MNEEDIKILEEFILCMKSEPTINNIAYPEEYRKEPIGVIKAIENLINRNKELETKLQEKDKIIDLMAEELVKAHEWFYSEFDNYTKEDFIKYFENKVKEE